MYESFKQYSPKGKYFNSSDLNLPSDNKKHLIAADTMYNFFKHAVEISNANLICNADHLLKNQKKICLISN